MNADQDDAKLDTIPLSTANGNGVNPADGVTGKLDKGSLVRQRDQIKYGSEEDLEKMHSGREIPKQEESSQSTFSSARALPAWVALLPLPAPIPTTQPTRVAGLSTNSILFCFLCLPFLFFLS